MQFQVTIVDLQFKALFRDEATLTTLETTLIMVAQTNPTTPDPMTKSWETLLPIEAVKAPKDIISSPLQILFPQTLSQNLKTLSRGMKTHFQAILSQKLKIKTHFRPRTRIETRFSQSKIPMFLNINPLQTLFQRLRIKDMISLNRLQYRLFSSQTPSRLKIKEMKLKTFSQRFRTNFLQEL